MGIESTPSRPVRPSFVLPPADLGPYPAVASAPPSAPSPAAELPRAGWSVSAAELAAEPGTRRPRWVARLLRRERASAIETYRRVLAERAVEARRELLRAGVHLGPVPYGYRLGPDRRLTPDRDTAHIVQQIFHWRVVRQCGPAEIARVLRRDPRVFPSPVRADGLPGGWTTRAVAAILANPRYTGRQIIRSARDGGGRSEPAVLTRTLVHPPLVADEVWRLAQAAGRPLPAELEPLTTRLDAQTRRRDAGSSLTPDGNR
jgi:hypothetical protein